MRPSVTLPPKKPCACSAHHADDATERGTPPDLSRRGFVRLAALGGGAALFGFSPPAEASSGHGIEALLLSCMDFRLLDHIVRYMDGRGLTHQYDHVILAGASLGALNDQFPAWGKTFWDHLDVSIKLHEIKKVMIMDHRDCGAYKVILKQDLAGDPARETQVHSGQLRNLAGQVKAKYPQLGVELLLMGLDGKVESIPADGPSAAMGTIPPVVAATATRGMTAPVPSAEVVTAAAAHVPVAEKPVPAPPRKRSRRTRGGHDDDGGYGMHIASYKTHHGAERGLAELRRRKKLEPYTAYLVPASNPQKGEVYRIVFGNMRLSETRDVCRQVREQGLYCAPVTLGAKAEKKG
ncbi:MAG: twin-arginine translocation signal domain-containing protein [Rhodospirillales bacterium]|nr:twin-arginine translocation signal domain-containing protein [Rhodospirillales bacterium]